MSSKKRRGKPQKQKKKFYSESFLENENPTHEKAKARDLRHSSWWNKKTVRGECYYCRKIVKPDELTMDHKIPISRGGKSEKMNLVPACKDCNNKKKNLLPLEWDEYMNRLNSTKEEIDGK
jgi:5-methylcytosine-specific restriction enzyme A